MNTDGFQGWGIDHRRKLLFIRSKTAEAYIIQMSKMAEEKKATLEELESLIGKLNWLSTIILQARVLAPPVQWLLNRHKILDVDGKLKNKKMKVGLGDFICADLRLGVELLKANSSLPAIYTVFNHFYWPHAIDATSDAAQKHGFGWVVHDTGKWASVDFRSSPWAMSLDQNQAEGLGTLSLVLHLGKRARDEKCILRLEIDNSAIMAAVAKEGSFRPRLYAISRAIVMTAAKYKIRVYTRFVESDENIADWPSRQDVKDWFPKFKLACSMHKGPWSKAPVYPTEEVKVDLENLRKLVQLGNPPLFNPYS